MSAVPVEERVARLEARADSIKGEMKEVKEGIEKIQDNQTAQIRWTVAAFVAGLGVTLTLGLWLAERLTA